MKMDSQTLKKLSKLEFKISDRIVWNDHHFLVFDKPAGLPSQADLSNDSSALQLAEIYTKTKLHLLTRLDRPASGLILMSKGKKANSHFQEQKTETNLKKSYLALVEGIVDKKSGILKQFLLHDKSSRKARIVDAENPKGKEAILHFELIKALERYSILRIELETGRFHQIRCQLAGMGHPIKGDVKYGARRSNKDRSIYLNCYELALLNYSKDKQIHCFAKLDTKDNLWKIIQETLNTDG